MNIAKKMVLVSAFVYVLALAIGCGNSGSGGGSDMPSSDGNILFASSPPKDQNFSGAIFTSTADGTAVNQNIFASKDDVYLNGGPQNENAKGLPDGTYYFQVTGPANSGPGETLLSEDGIACRKVTVVGGVVAGSSSSLTTPGSISSPECKHPNGSFNPNKGSTPVKLMPFADTPNEGGVYKVHLTKIGDYDPSDTQSVFGFINSKSKTDNFRVVESVQVGSLVAIKWYDFNANGILDNGEQLLSGWEVTINPLDGAPEPATQLTNSSVAATWTNLTPGIYSVTEGIPNEPNWIQSGSAVNGTPTDPNPMNPVMAEVSANQVTFVDFGNYCTVPSNGKTLGYWSNKNGQATLNDGGTMAPELALLSSYNLRNANGSNFDPTSYTQLRNWLLNATATNMSYMLSAQLATMVLDIEAGFVDGNAFYIPFGGTINDLVSAANAALLADGFTPAGDEPNRTNQETLKNYLDALNNNDNVVPVSPCVFTFPQ